MSERAARQCGGKKRHRSERRAEEAARITQRYTGCAMKAYECPFCFNWHVGAVEVHDCSVRQLPRKERYVRERI